MPLLCHMIAVKTRHRKASLIQFFSRFSAKKTKTFESICFFCGRTTFQFASRFCCVQVSQVSMHFMQLFLHQLNIFYTDFLSRLDCRVGAQKANSVEFSTVPEPGSILLEQWTVSMTYEGGAGNSGVEGVGEGETLVSPPYQISSRSLLQAVRSYLHFSQLAAWYSKSGGAEPRNILVRITIPDEAFSR